MRDSSSSTRRRDARCAIAVAGASACRRSRAARPAAVARPRRRAPASPRRTCTTAPSSSANSAASALAGDRRRARRRGRSATRTPFRQRRRTGRRRRCRDRRAACRRACSRCTSAKNAASRSRIVEVRRLVAELPVDLRQRRCRRGGCCPPPRSMQHQRRVAARRVAAAASASLRASATGANADTISDTGAVTALSTPSSRPRRAHRHRILADRDRQAERDAQFDRHRAHRVVQRGVLARMPGRRHPVGRQLDVAERRECRRRRCW